MSKIITSPFHKRFLSALILGPVCLWALLSGGTPFYILVGLAAGFSISEWFIMSRRLNGYGLIMFSSLAGLAYICICLLCFVLLPPYFNVALLLGVWTSDIGAFFVGKKFGRWKIVPAISPNKTFAGFVGACLSPALIALIISLVYNKKLTQALASLCDVSFLVFPHSEMMLNPFLYLSSPVVFISFFLVGLAGQGGDLLISAMKRKVGVKDTGSVIPGHGGVLDRIDALLMASAFFFGVLVLAKSLSC